MKVRGGLLVSATVLALAAIACKSTEPAPPAEKEEKPVPPSQNVVVTIQTNLGTIEVELNEERATQTVRNFLDYVRANFYDETIFHRIAPSFVIQGGGFTAGLEHKATRPPIRNESDNGLSNTRGTIAMARTGDPNSATSQFYINLKDNLSLDARPGMPGYAVFGNVISGMDVVDKIAVVKTHTAQAPDGPRMGNVPLEPVVINSIRIKQ